MAEDIFARALAFTLQWEGEYVNDPNDPGGETKWGISKRAHPDLDIASLTVAQATDIYRRDYWTAAGCEAREARYAVVLFDTAVNLGVVRAHTLVQAATTWEALLLARIEHYVTIAWQRRTMERYLLGWLRRCMSLAAYCRGMAA